MQQHCSQYIAPRPPYPGQKVKIQLFQNMVMLPIKLKGIMKCNMVAKYLDGVNRSSHFFQNIVMLHIKLKGMTNTALYIFCPVIHPRPLGWGQRSKTFFSESSHISYQIYGNGT